MEMQALHAAYSGHHDLSTRVAQYMKYLLSILHCKSICHFIDNAVIHRFQCSRRGGNELQLAHVSLYSRQPRSYGRKAQAHHHRLQPRSFGLS